MIANVIAQGCCHDETRVDVVARDWLVRVLCARDASVCTLGVLSDRTRSRAPLQSEDPVRAKTANMESGTHFRNELADR